MSKDLVFADLLSPAFNTAVIQSKCQIEIRLVAQPFAEDGTVQDFGMHIISRPFPPGSEQGFELARRILKEIKDIKSQFDVKDADRFGLYPGTSSDPLLVAAWNKNVVKNYGGKFLKTLAFMGSRESAKWAFFSGPATNPSSENQGASFGLSSLARPSFNEKAGEDDTFQVASLQGEALSVKVLNSKGLLIDNDFGDHYPGIKRFLANPTDVAHQQEILDLENVRRIDLPNSDCTSCHHVTAVHSFNNSKLEGTKFDTESDRITVIPENKGILQDKMVHFLNFGYVKDSDKETAFQNRSRVSQHVINHAALSAAFLNRNRSFWFRD